jgi:hypothetical protein
MSTTAAGITQDALGLTPHEWGYSVKVRTQPQYLWGSKGLAQDVLFPTPLLLHIANDAFGDPVTIRTETAAGAKTKIGTIEPGEHVSIPVQQISGVVATCVHQSTVACVVRKS